MRVLIYITSSYPFGKKETYLDTELKVISKGFDRIYVLPIYIPGNSKETRDVPDNVKVLEPILEQGGMRILQFLTGFRYKRIYFKEFFESKIFLSSFKIKKWLNSYTLFLVGSKRIKKLINKQPEKYIVYSYWGEAPFFIHSSLSLVNKVVRMHGADFYEERNQGYLPLRTKIYNSSDLLLPISVDIARRLANHYYVSPEKIFLSYLGTFGTNAKTCCLKVDKIMRVVSCSNVYPLKRIHLIYEILKSIDDSITIVWSHIGSGEELDSLKKKFLDNSKANIKVNFLGQMTTDEIQRLYQNEYFDFFFNTSEYEGIPVSIMEAFSYGIPAIATDVGGTSEIVNSTNGLLIEKNFDVDKVANKVQNLYMGENRGLRKGAYSTWLTKFNASENYQKLLNKFLR